MSNRGSKHGPGSVELGLGSLFEALGDAVAEVTRRLEEGQTGEVHRSYDVDTGKGPIRAEAGVRVRFADGSSAGTASGVRPVNRPGPAPRGQGSGQAGAAPTGSEGAASPPRTIEYDVFEDASGWRLTADLPGVGPDDLTLSDAGAGQVLIETSGTRRYRTVVDLPADARAADLQVHINNGILALRFAPTKGA